ncbi:MAG: hypothetical protein AABX37_01770 [Nanoarchaeota archaeon]
MRKLLSIMAFVVMSLLAISLVSALDNSNLNWGRVEVNGDEVEVGDESGSSEVLAVEEGQTLNVRVGLQAVSGANDVEVEAKISGYEYSDYESLSDSTALFNIAAGTTKYVNLEVTLPNRLEKETYWLRLRVLDKNTPALESVIQLAVEPTRHGVGIADVSFSPSTTIKAGRSLLATVLLENIGEDAEKDVKVTVSIPALGVSATEFVDMVETDNHNVESEDVPEMFLPIPATAVEGDYEVVVTAKYDDLRETATKKMNIHVVADERFQPVEDQLVLAVGPEAQNVAAGGKATYGVALTNNGPRSKAYVLEVVTGDWGSATVSENLVVLEPGRNKVVYVDVNVAQSTQAGEYLASLAIKSGNEVLETVPLKAMVVSAAKQTSGADGTNVNLRNGLEIALIVLVVLLVIIGLIVGFSRLRKDNEEEQTYY